MCVNLMYLQLNKLCKSFTILVNSYRICFYIQCDEYPLKWLIARLLHPIQLSFDAHVVAPGEHTIPSIAHQITEHSEHECNSFELDEIALLNESHSITALGNDFAALAAQHLLVVCVNADAETATHNVELRAGMTLLDNGVGLVFPAGRIILNDKLLATTSSQAALRFIAGLNY